MSYATKVGQDIAEQRRSRGPSRREIDTEKMFELASIGMSQQQISDWFGMSLSTFQSNQDWVDIFNEGKSDFQKTILSHQYNIAVNVDHKDQHKMLIHLGKTQLGQKETQNVEATVSTSFETLMDLVKK